MDERKVTKIVYSQTGEIFVNDQYLVQDIKISARHGFTRGWLTKITLETTNDRVIVYQVQPKLKKYKHETEVYHTTDDDGIHVDCVCGWTHNFGFTPSVEYLHKIVSSHVRPKPGYPDKE